MLKPPGPLVLDRAAVERLALGLMCMFPAALSFSAATSAAVVGVGRSMSSGLPAVWASMKSSGLPAVWASMKFSFSGRICRLRFLAARLGRLGWWPMCMYTPISMRRLASYVSSVGVVGAGRRASCGGGSLRLFAAAGFFPTYTFLS